MLAKDIIKILDAEPININNKQLLEKEYQFCFATDLMSDALAMISNDDGSTVLLTGCCNIQSLRTAEMLDLELIVYVRGKMLDTDNLDMTKEMQCNIFTTHYTMFDACGKLYAQGLKGVNVE